MSESLRDLAASWRRSLRAEDRSDNTIEVYMTAVRVFDSWLQDRGLTPTLDELTRANVRDWSAEMLGNGAAVGTVLTRFRPLKSFCSWLVREEILDRSPLEGMPLPKVPEKPTRVLSDDELIKLIKTCAGSGFYARRDEAILRVLIECGVRASELCAMRTEELDLDAQQAVVHGKGRKTRLIYFGNKTTRALDRYLRERRRHPQADSPYLWLSHRGALSYNGLRRIVDKRAALAGIGHVHPHMFRHTAAADFLQAGGQERDLMRIMGWSSSSMLARYGSATADARAREAVRRLRRGDRL